MRIFVAGATGALGRRLVPMLVARGHEVAGTTRSREKLAGLAAAGAEGALVDGLDREAVLAAVTRARPEVVVHQMTALADLRSPRRFDREFALTNRLRSEGTAHLIAAAQAAGARRFVAQSYAGWPYARTGGPVKTEEDELDPDPPRQMRRTLAAIRELEDAVLGARMEGLVLRYGGFYGPGTPLAVDGAIAKAVRRRQFPIVGGGTGVWSFVHIDDAASATAAAVERGAPGVYNVVDDDPAPVSQWLPALADALGARPPLRVPGWVGLLAIGRAGLSLMTSTRGASNARAVRELGWRPRYPSWRQGFRAAVSAAPDPRPAPDARASPG
ncbi:MAG TPA: NAD(P)-dependent oxidoreductase [Kofleriaceae bacterium]|nr:NAD(P)-dependent oxidoreductase [Kofleriaceae bacterium]